LLCDGADGGADDNDEVIVVEVVEYDVIATPMCRREVYQPAIDGSQPGNDVKTVGKSVGKSVPTSDIALVIVGATSGRREQNVEQVGHRRTSTVWAGLTSSHVRKMAVNVVGMKDGENVWDLRASPSVYVVKPSGVPTINLPFIAERSS